MTEHELDRGIGYAQKQRVYTYKVTLRQHLNVGGISPYKYAGAKPRPFTNEPQTTSPTVPRVMAKKMTHPWKDLRAPDGICQRKSQQRCSESGVKVTRTVSPVCRRATRAKLAFQWWGGAAGRCCVNIYQQSRCLSHSMCISAENILN